jgi:RNA polymerase sigma-70 factor (ECF subfamily)
MGSPLTTSVSLLDRLRRPANHEAWCRFVQLYTPLLHHWACRTGWQQAEAADLVQEVFAQLLRVLPRFQYEGQRSFRGWLHTVAVNKWNELRRRRQVPMRGGGPVEATDPQAADPAALLASEEFQRMMYQRALDIMRTDFPGNTWRACVAVVVEGRKAQEVARELGMTVGAIHAARFRVLARLRQELAGLMD